MERNPKNTARAINRLVGQLAAEKKKVVTALFLIALMAIMWVRVLTHKALPAAEAAVTSQEATKGRSNAESLQEISFIELPNISGRNDVLTRDFFTVAGSGLAGAGRLNAVSENGGDEKIKRIARKLTLEAIGLGENRQAFINDELLSIGDKLHVEDGLNTYECEVTAIEENMVLIRCAESVIKLKLVQTN